MFSNPLDPASVTEARLEQMSYVKKWIAADRIIRTAAEVKKVEL
jgi:hypothetical protein